MKWIFEGRVYSSLEELKGKTMSEGNQPEPMFTLEEMKDFAEWAANAPKTNNIYLSKGDRGMPQFMYEAMNKKVDVGEGAESESEL